MPAKSLEGRDLGNGWTVKSRIDNQDGTGGTFSVGYIVQNQNGEEAFLKALDFSSAFNQPNWADALKPMLDSYHFERNLYEKCKDKKMKRVVSPILAGHINVDGFPKPINQVHYIIFEKAIGSLRSPGLNSLNMDLSWKLRMLHNVTLGMMQLHKAEIAHQDLKLSNVLVFDDDHWRHNTAAKITDLGRASDAKVPFVNDKFRFAGDQTYAPLDRCYPTTTQIQTFVERVATDHFLLGGLVYIFFNHVPLKSTMVQKMSQPKIAEFLRSDFNADLPYIKAAFDEAIEEFEKNISPACGNLSSEIVKITRKLCEPDPRERGNKSINRSLIHQYDLQWCVSAFDRLATLAEIGRT